MKKLTDWRRSHASMRRSARSTGFASRVGAGWKARSARVRGTLVPSAVKQSGSRPPDGDRNARNSQLAAQRSAPTFLPNFQDRMRAISSAQNVHSPLSGLASLFDAPAIPRQPHQSEG